MRLNDTIIRNAKPGPKLQKLLDGDGLYLWRLAHGRRAGRACHALRLSTRNSIMLLSHFDYLVSQEACLWNRETCLRGTAERFLPITMTALALVPIAASYGQPGQEIEAPMAIVILAGLLASTALNLLVPVLALRYARFEKRAT